MPFLDMMREIPPLAVAVFGIARPVTVDVNLA